MKLQSYKPILTTRKTCRICGSTALTPVVSLGKQFIGGVLASADGEAYIKRQVPMDLVRCDPAQDESACSLVQLAHTVPPKVLYSQYYYQSGINQSMRDNLRSIVNTVENSLQLNPNDIVLDIGCNDGTLLDSYTVNSLQKIGIDPSDVALMAQGKGYSVVNDFFSHRAFCTVYPNDKARVITSISMFYDLENPHTFVADIAATLSKDGIWILEQSYLPIMLEKNSFDTICHEHLEYYSLAAIEYLLEYHKLEVIDANLNDVNGGSIRLVVAHQGQRNTSAESTQRLQDLRLKEFDLALDTDLPFARFRANVEQVRADLIAFLRLAKSQGKLVHGYGASTKGNTTMQYCGIDANLVLAIADRNPRKWGSYTIGSQIKIISEEESRAQKPDYYLVLPWHFLDEFVQREHEFLARGGQFIVPMPEVRLISQNQENSLK